MTKKILSMAALCLICFTLGSCEKKSNNANNTNTSSDEPEMPGKLEIVGGMLPGKFSIDEDLQIQFSQGNLQYLASTKKWRFAEHQYDTIGNANINISTGCSNWIDLFGWGTGNNPTKTDTDYKTYSYFSDWGKNPISNGGNEANAWRTLSDTEWDYLVNNRKNASNLRAKARVNGLNGNILLPDDFELPKGVTFEADASSWSKNTYTISQWSILEVAGAVFFPCAGRRYKTEMQDGTYGNYWSSTPKIVSGAINGEATAYYMNFSQNSLKTDLRTYGMSVRLVKDVK